MASCAATNLDANERVTDGDKSLAGGDVRKPMDSLTNNARADPVSGGPSRRRRPLDYVGVLAVAVLGYFSLWVPWGGDTALFGTAARTLNAGGIYLRDFWDIKQPGIYWFYQVADLLPGPLWVPSRVLTVVWMVGLAFLVRHVAVMTVKSIWLQRLAPLIVVGPLMLTGGPDFLGVPESLIGLPLLGSAVLLAHSVMNTRFRASLLFTAGLVGSVALFLKVQYIFVLAVFLVSAVLGGRRHRLTTGLGEALKFTSWYVVGLVVPVVGYVALTVGQGQFRLLLATTFAFPRAISALGTLHDHSLYKPFLKAAVKVLAPWVVLAGLAIPLWRRLPTLLVATALAWSAATVAIIAIQRPSLYQTHALLVPLGLIAMWVVDVLIAEWSEQTARWESVVAIAAVAVAAATWLFVPSDGSSRAGLAADVVRSGGVPSENALVEVAEKSSLEFVQQELVAGTAPRSADSLYVLGHPLLYVLLDQSQAIEINGWSSEFAVPAQWSGTERELRRTRPGLVAVSDHSMQFLAKDAPGILTLLERKYTKTAVPELGLTWFSRIDPRGLGPVPPTSEGILLEAP